jgi:hypothetical protein
VSKLPCDGAASHYETENEKEHSPGPGSKGSGAGAKPTQMVASPPRYTAATLMLLQGIHPKIVQETLGHASITLTLDTYSHVVPSMQLEAARKMDALFR